MRPWFTASVCVVLFLSGGIRAAAAQETTPSAHVTVTGEVQHPGSVPFTPNMTVGQAIAAAGGVTDRADQLLSVTRHSGGMAVSRGGVPPGFIIQPGDQVSVGRRPYAGAGPRIEVSGEVRNPGTYTVTAGPALLSRAIAAAGGFSERAGNDIQISQRSGPARRLTYINHVARGSMDGEGTQVGLLNDNAEIAVMAAAPVTAGSDSLGRVTVMGDVPRAGVLPLADLTLRSAMERVGGVNHTALGTLRIVRAPADGSGFSESVSYDVVASGALDLPLHDGDTISVPTGGGWTLRDDRSSRGRTTFSSFGSWFEGMTLQRCLDNVNRPNPFGRIDGSLPIAASQVEIEREVNDQIQRITPTADFVLQPKDVIVVVR